MRLWLASLLLQALLAVRVASQSSDSTSTLVTDPSESSVSGSTVTVDSSASTASSDSSADPSANPSASPASSDAVSGSTTSGAVTTEGSTTSDGPHADCYLCAPTVQCGETIEGDFSSADVNVLFMKAMEDDDVFIVKGEVFENAEEIFFDVFKDLSVGKAQVGVSHPTLLQFQHFFDTNLTFSRSGLQGDQTWDSFRPAILPLPIRQKKPWTLMFKMHQNLTGFETGDETGWFNNHIPWNGTATTQSFNIRGGWKTTSVQYNCANSSISIL